MKYKISKKEDIGCLPYGAIILNAKIISEGDNNDALIYFPKKLKYEFEGEIGYDNGCGCLSFASKVPYTDYWERSENNYINVKGNKYEI